MSESSVNWYLDRIAVETDLKSLRDNRNYRSLIQLNLPWSTIVPAIDDIPDPDHRLYLRSIEPMYVQDYLVNTLPNLPLDSDYSPDTLLLAWGLLGSLYDARHTYGELSGKISSLIRECQDMLEREGLIPEDSTSWDMATATRAVTVLSNVLFGSHSFSPDMGDTYSFESHFLQGLLGAHSQGLPLTLSVLFLIVGQHINLPVYGVNLPRRFMVLYRGNGFLFYIDPWMGGGIRTESEIADFITSESLPMIPEYRQPASLRIMLRRAIANLVAHARRESDSRLAGFLEFMHRKI